jgi:hypothetical protein
MELRKEEEGTETAEFGRIYTTKNNSKAKGKVLRAKQGT